MNDMEGLDLPEVEAQRFIALQRRFSACRCELIRPPPGDSRRPFYVRIGWSIRVMDSLDAAERFLPMVGGGR